MIRLTLLLSLILTFGPVSLRPALAGVCGRGVVSDIRPLLSDYVLRHKALINLTDRRADEAIIDQLIIETETCEMDIVESVFNIRNGQSDSYYQAKQAQYLRHIKQINALGSLHPQAISGLGAKLQNRWDNTAAIDFAKRAHQRSDKQWLIYALAMGYGAFTPAREIVSGPIGEAMLRRFMLRNVLVQEGTRFLADGALKSWLSKTRIPPPSALLALAPPSRNMSAIAGDEMMADRMFQGFAFGGGVAAYSSVYTSKIFRAPQGAGFIRRFGGGLGSFLTTLAIDFTASTLFTEILNERNRRDLREAVRYQLKKLNEERDGSVFRNLWRAKALVDLSFLAEVETRLQLVKLASQLHPDLSEQRHTEILADIRRELKRSPLKQDSINFAALELVRETGFGPSGQTALARAARVYQVNADQPAKLNQIRGETLKRLASQAYAGRLTFSDSVQLQLEIFSALATHKSRAVRKFAEDAFKERLTRAVILQHFAEGGLL